MTPAEFHRWVKSRIKVIEIQERKQASFDYTLADLIGRSMSRVYNSSNKMPSIAEAYPSLFDKEEEKQAKQAKNDELSAIRFKLFAQAFNSNFKGGGKEDNERRT